MSSSDPAFRPEPIIRRLAVFPGAVRSLISGLDTPELVWRPSPDRWSVTEVLAHLALEEVQDFRPRLERILADPQPEWDPIDPESAVRAADAHGRGAEHWLAAFESERAASVTWLTGLKSPDWSRERVHPVFGGMSARGMLGAWAAHDALHLRQIAKRMFERAGLEAGAHEAGYAGSWKERGGISPAPSP